MIIKTVYDLKRFVESMGHAPYFFTRNNMKFAGDTMRNYGLITHKHYYELYRKKPVMCGIKGSAYFDKVTGRLIHNIASFLSDKRASL